LCPKQWIAAKKVKRKEAIIVVEAVKALAGYDEDPRKKKTPKKTPPISPGMKKLSGTLQAFVDFMYLDKDTLTAALESASDIEPSQPTPKEIKDWVAGLPDKDRQQIIVDLLLEKTTAQPFNVNYEIVFSKNATPKLQKHPNHHAQKSQ